MEKKNKVAYIAYVVGSISYAIMLVYTFISVLIIISMIAEGDGDEVLMSLPWMIGVLVGGFAETGVCFVISEVVQLLDDSSKYLSECVNYLKNSHNSDSTEKLYNEELPEL